MENTGYLPKRKKSHVHFNPWYYQDRYELLHKDYMNCPPLSKLDCIDTDVECIDYKIETKQKQENKQGNKHPREIYPKRNEVIIIDEPVSRPELGSRHTSPKTSEKYYTGEEDLTDTSESVSSFERLLNENLNEHSINDLLQNLCHEFVDDRNEYLPPERFQCSRTEVDNKFIRERACAKIDPTSVWSKVIYFTDQVMQTNIKSGITDTSFQLPLAVLVGSSLVSSTIQILPSMKNLYCTLQPFISPCEPTVQFKTQELCNDRKPSNTSPSRFHRSQQYSTPKSSVNSKVNDWMFDLSESTIKSHCTDNLMADLEKYEYFKSLDGVKNLVNSESVQELVGDNPDVCGDCALNFDDDLAEKHCRIENPMLKIIPSFINENYGC